MITIKKPRKRHFKGKKKNYSVRFPRDLYEFFTKVAKQSSLGIADVMGDVLDEVAENWIAEANEMNQPKRKEKP